MHASHTLTCRYHYMTIFLFKHFRTSSANLVFIYSPWFWLMAEMKCLHKSCRYLAVAMAPFKVCSAMQRGVFIHTIEVQSWHVDLLAPICWKICDWFAFAVIFKSQAFFHIHRQCVAVGFDGIEMHQNPFPFLIYFSDVCIRIDAFLEPHRLVEAGDS